MGSKKFTLFIDESGDFFENDFEGRSSLVGGFFIESGQDIDLLTSKIIENVKESLLFKINLNISEKDLYHATSLPNKFKSIIKLFMVREIIDSEIQPVVFQQDKMEGIGQNTINYLVFLSDGIIKLARYMMLNADDDIDLNIVLERRKNLDTRRGVIPEKDIRSKLDEYIRHAKIRDSSFFPYKFNFKIYIDDGKRGPLVLSDYICNMYYTRETCKKYLTHDYLKDLNRCLKQYYKFQICEYPSIQMINKLISNGRLAEAMFEVMKEERFEDVNDLKDVLRTKIKGLSEISQKKIIDKLSSDLNLLLKDKRECKLVLKICNRVIEEVASKNIFSNHLRNEFLADINLYKLAALSHLGYIDNFINVSSKCIKYINNSNDLEKYLIYINRCIVNYLDIGDYEQAMHCAKDIEKVFKCINNINLEVDRLMVGKFILFKEQQAKIYGSIANLYYYMSINDKRFIESARLHSDKAISCFDYEVDKKRQYQLRAHIEVEAGDIENAFKYLCKGICPSGERLSVDHLSTFRAFEWYHLMKFIVRGEIRTNLTSSNLIGIPYRNILLAFKVYEKKFFSFDAVHPDFITLMLGIYVAILIGEEGLAEHFLGKLKKMEIKICESKIFYNIFLQLSIYILTKSENFNKKYLPVLKHIMENKLDYNDKEVALKNRRGLEAIIKKIKNQSDLSKKEEGIYWWDEMLF